MLEPKRTVWRALSLMLTVVALVGIPTRALASDAPPKTAEEAAEDEPVKPSENRKGEVKEIGLYITNVTKVDVQKESWELEAQLTSRAPDACAGAPFRKSRSSFLPAR